MLCQPLTITLSDTDQQALEKLANRPSAPQQIAQRARIVLKAADGQNNAEITRTLGINIKMVRLVNPGMGFGSFNEREANFERVRGDKLNKKLVSP